MDNSVKQRTSQETLDDSVSKAIDAKVCQTRDILKEIERNTRISFEGHVTHHKYLMDAAKQRGDIATAIHHQVVMETYQSILKNFSMSGAYDTA